MNDKNPTQGIDEDIREWMLKLGYVHDSEVEKATNTVSRTRARWKPLRPVYFGKEPYYHLADIKRYLDERAGISKSDDELVCL